MAAARIPIGLAVVGFTAIAATFGLRSAGSTPERQRFIVTTRAAVAFGIGMPLVFPQLWFVALPFAAVVRVESEPAPWQLTAGTLRRISADPEHSDPAIPDAARLCASGRGIGARGLKSRPRPHIRQSGIAIQKLFR